MVVLRIHVKLSLYEHVVYAIHERDRHALVPVIRSHNIFINETIFYSIMFLGFMLHMHAFGFSTIAGFCYIWCHVSVVKYWSIHHMISHLCSLLSLRRLVVTWPKLNLVDLLMVHYCSMMKIVNFCLIVGIVHIWLGGY